MGPRWIEVLLAIAALTILGPGKVYAQGQINIQPSAMFQNEGRDPISFNVTLSSGYLTIIVSSDTIARSTFIQNVSSNTSNACISTSSGSAACGSSWAGVQIPPNSSLTDYTRSAWYGRLPTGIATQTISGYRTRDRGDYGSIASPGR